MRTNLFFVLLLLTVITIFPAYTVIGTSFAQTDSEQTGFGDSASDRNTTLNSINPNLTLSNINSDPNLYGNYYKDFTDNETSSDWRNISGKWSYTPDGLHGGDIGNTPYLINSIILSPFTTKIPFNISTSFTINEIENNAYNYATIIYSFIDLDNFQIAGVYIYNDDVYVRFTNISNGIATFDPPKSSWEKTNLEWNPGTLFNMTLSLHGTSQDLIINGTKYLTHNNADIDENGHIGLSYVRIDNIDFHDFEIEKLSNDAKASTSNSNNLSDGIIIRS